MNTGPPRRFLEDCGAGRVHKKGVPRRRNPFFCGSRRLTWCCWWSFLRESSCWTWSAVRHGLTGGAVAHRGRLGLTAGRGRLVVRVAVCSVPAAVDLVLVEDVLLCTVWAKEVAETNRAASSRADFFMALKRGKVDGKRRAYGANKAGPGEARVNGRGRLVRRWTAYGKSSTNVEPWPGSDSASSRAPWNSAMVLAMGSPSP